MPNIIVQIRDIKFDVRKYKASLQKKFERDVRMSARAFLKAAFARVPVESGMARASLRPLGRVLRTAVPTPGAKPSRKKSRIRTQAAGERQGKKPPYFSFDNFNFTFQYSLKVFHYIVNENKTPGGIGPTGYPYPWRSMEFGRKAFDKEMRARIRKNLPKIAKFLKFSRWKRAK